MAFPRSVPEPLKREHRSSDAARVRHDSRVTGGNWRSGRIGGRIIAQDRTVAHATRFEHVSFALWSNFNLPLDGLGCALICARLLTLGLRENVYCVWRENDNR